MPRDSSGNMTLPATNPVVADTDITTTWANGTMSDLAAEVEDSLSRSGKGGMLVPFQNMDGTVSAPGVTFTNDTTTGVYRPSGSLAVAVGGVLHQLWASALTTFKKAVKMDSTLEVTGVATFTAKPVLTAGITGITADDLPATKYSLSSSTSGFGTSSASWTDVTNAVSTDFVATGRPIGIFLVDDGSGNECQITSTGTGTYFQVLEGSTALSYTVLANNGAFPPGVMLAFRVPAAGTYTYKVQVKNVSASAAVRYCKLLVMEF